MVDKEKAKTETTKEEAVGGLGITPEQADRFALELVEIKKLFEKKDTSLQASQILSKQDEVLTRLQDLYTRLGGLESTVRNFMDYLTAENKDAGGQAKTPQPQRERGTPDYTGETGITSDALNGIDWKFNKMGEWTYSRNRDGSESNDPTVQEIVYMIKKKGGTITLYGMDYTLSGEGDMFLGRREHGSGFKPQRGRRNY